MLRSAKWRRFGRRITDPKKAEYLIPADPSLGTGFDPAAAHLLRLDLEQLNPLTRSGPLIVQDAVLYGQIPPDELAALCYECSEHHYRCQIAAEDNGVGSQVVSTLARLRAKQVTRRAWDPITRSSRMKPGWHTDVSTKPAIRATLRRAVAEGLVEINDLETAQDLGHITIGEGRGGVVEAMTAKGETDHLEMALAIGVYILLTKHFRAWSGAGSEKSQKVERKVVPLHRNKPILTTWQIEPGRERWG